MKSTLKKKTKKITAKKFDVKFERGEDITPFLDFKKAAVIRLDQVLGKMQSTAAKRKITAKTIEKEIKSVRQTSFKTRNLPRNRNSKN